MTGWSIRTPGIALLVLGAAFCVATPAWSFGGTVRVGGTGMALATMQQAGDNLKQVDPAITVTVLPSLGTPGGLKALVQGAIDVAVIGRPLKADEAAKGAVQAGCLSTPLLFATSHPSPHGVALTEIPGFYANAQPVWRDGKPLKVILRSRAGSENAYLAATIPGMEAALEAAYRRPDIPVATTDQENAEQAARIENSFAVMTMLQMRAEKLKLRPVALDGVMPSASAIADKTYPMGVAVCVVLPTNPTPAAAKFVAHLKSEAGSALLSSLGATALK